VQTASQQSTGQELDALAMLLQSLNPAAGFQVAGAHARSHTNRLSNPAMKMKPKPREGEPFDHGIITPEMAGTDSYQPLTTARTPAVQYIETDDEPWTYWLNALEPVTAEELDEAFDAALPYWKPELALEDALVKCTSPEDIDKAIATALEAGAREGCPAQDTAEKLKQEMEKAIKDGKKVPKAKARKVAGGGAKPGFAMFGDDRKLGKVHDNSVG